MASTGDPKLAAYLVHMAELASEQDLTEDVRGSVSELGYSFTALAVIFVLVRFGAKYKQGGYTLDDWLLVVATAFLIGNTALLGMSMYFIFLFRGCADSDSGQLWTGPTYSSSCFKGAKWITQCYDGWQGKDRWLRGVLKTTDWSLQLLLVHEPLLFLNLTIVKISILLMYYRLFPSRVVRTRAMILGIFAILWTIVLVCLAEGQCVPLKKAYAPWIDGRCFNLRIIFVAIALPSIILDSLIVLLPLPQVWKLDINKAQKITLSLIFLTGAFVVVMSIYRFVVLFEYHPMDPIFTLAPGMAWNIVVLSSAIIAACLPALGPMGRVFIKSLRAAIPDKNDIENPHVLNSLPSRFWPGKEKKHISIEGSRIGGDNSSRRTSAAGDSLKSPVSLKRPESSKGPREEDVREQDERGAMDLIDALNSPSKLAVVVEASESDCDDEEHGIITMLHVCECQSGKFPKEQRINRNTL
ncbi:hypothetical protein HYALB_00003917 [Hymenoscyphus albidus]|uniref:Rhodopsin domain-containing protein n=1 Tax=Hymenoscyphus albidus TaxID=595503 RepID=A0A9N9LY99_9HELO|nr:hypothetical protein HYALB_00003917 [Hymenoscyphus albidus]